MRPDEELDAFLYEDDQVQKQVKYEYAIAIR